MQSVYERLVRTDDNMILLFTPPFDRTLREVGYIQGYPPGVRENGGQYTHAALWAIWAFAELGQQDRAAALYHMLNPVYHADTFEKMNRYRVEPYIVAADIYSVPPHLGRGGWTWYTGSASWMYRVGLESILGVQRQGDKLLIKPSIPSDWPGYSLDYHFGDTVYHIDVENPNGTHHAVSQVVMDGQHLPDYVINLRNDAANHEIVITLI